MNYQQKMIKYHLWIIKHTLNKLFTNSFVKLVLHWIPSISVLLYLVDNLPSVPNGKLLLVNKGIQSLNLLHLFLILFTSLLTTLPLAPIVSPRQFLQFQQKGHWIQCLEIPPLCLFNSYHNISYASKTYKIVIPSFFTDA